jgi:hypothetical protein
MTDEDVIRKLYSVFNVGTVVLRKNISGRSDNRKRKQSYIWSSQKQKDVLFILKSILPYMGNRRSLKIIEMIKLLEERLG